MDPMRQKSRAWRETGSLKPAIEYPHQSKEPNDRTHSENKITDSAHRQSEHQKVTRIDPVANKSVDKFGNTVNNAVQSQEYAQVCLSEMQRDVGFHIRYCHT